jgi:hypothetical protein
MINQFLRQNIQDGDFEKALKKICHRKKEYFSAINDFGQDLKIPPLNDHYRIVNKRKKHLQITVSLAHMKNNTCFKFFNQLAAFSSVSRDSIFQSSSIESLKIIHLNDDYKSIVPVINLISKIYNIKNIKYEEIIFQDTYSKNPKLKLTTNKPLPAPKDDSDKLKEQQQIVSNESLKLSLRKQTNTTSSTPIKIPKPPPYTPTQTKFSSTSQQSIKIEIPQSTPPSSVDKTNTTSAPPAKIPKAPPNTQTKCSAKPQQPTITIQKPQSTPPLSVDKTNPNSAPPAKIPKAPTNTQIKCSAKPQQPTIEKPSKLNSIEIGHQTQSNLQINKPIPNAHFAAQNFPANPANSDIK